MKPFLIGNSPFPLFDDASYAMQWLPSLMLLLSIAISFFTPESATYLPTLIFGTYMGWIYLRYLQKKPEAKHRGDPNEEFAFSTFFPEFLRYCLAFLLAHEMTSSF